MITITDILKTNITSNKELNNNLPFILISTPNVNETQLLFKVPNAPKNNIIYKLNYQYIYNLLKSNNIDPTFFSPMGDLWFNDVPSIVNILLVNTKISVKPIDYIKIDNYYNLSIWKPIGPSGYTALGFIASVQKPSITIIRLIPNIFLKEYNNDGIISDGRNTNMNEYDLLATINEKYFTLDKSIFIKNDCGKDNICAESVDSTESCDVWSMKNENGITLLEDDEPWYKEKKFEHEQLLLQNGSPSEDITDTFDENVNEEVKPENKIKYNVNFNIIACSLLFLISIMIGFKYFWKIQ